MQSTYRLVNSPACMPRVARAHHAIIRARQCRFSNTPQSAGSSLTPRTDSLRLRPFPHLPTPVTPDYSTILSALQHQTPNGP